MNLEKAKILDAILLKFTGNVTITWNQLQHGLCEDIATYYVIENNINYLIGDGQLKRGGIMDLSLSLTDKGFATMTDLPNLGYVVSAKRDRNKRNWSIAAGVITVLTFLILVYDTWFKSPSTNSDNILNSKTERIPVYSDSSSTFTKEISKSRSLGYLEIRRREKLLYLDSLQNGFKNLQIRFWYDTSRTRNKKLVEITNTDSLWSVKIYEFTIDWKNEKEIVSSKVENIVGPQSGWNIFFNSLLNLNILTLPDMNDIPNLTDNWKDGDSYYIEIASKNKYRFYGYHVPSEFPQYWQASNILKILELFSKELTVRE